MEVLKFNLNPTSKVKLVVTSFGVHLTTSPAAALSNVGVPSHFLQPERWSGIEIMGKQNNIGGR